MVIVIYGSKYGTARRYATEIAKRTDAVCISYDECKEINEYDTVIYVELRFGNAAHKSRFSGWLFIDPGVKECVIEVYHSGDMEYFTAE